MANANIVPPNAEKLIFAVDIVRFFLKKHHPHIPFQLLKTYVVKNVNAYRPHVRELLDDNMEKVLKEIGDKQANLIRSDFLGIQSNGGIHASSLRDYCTTLQNGNINEEILAGNFLTHCARLASMACLFYANGSQDALDVGVDLIESSFPNDPEKCNLIFKSMEDAVLKYASEAVGETSSFDLRRNLELSNTEDSNSNSSTSTNEMDSEEALANLIFRLNASVSSNSVKNKNNESSMISSSTVAAAACAAAASAEASESSESSESSIQNPTVSSSLSSRVSEALKCDVDIPAKIETYFKAVESQPTILHSLLSEPSRNPLYGKRSSPKKESPPDTSEEETEIKKPKFGQSKTDDENE